MSDKNINYDNLGEEPLEECNNHYILVNYLALYPLLLININNIYNNIDSEYTVIYDQD